jgi:hypothetical protein
VKHLGLNFQPIEEVIHETVTSFKECGWLAWLCSGWLIPMQKVSVTVSWDHLQVMRWGRWCTSNSCVCFGLATTDMTLVGILGYV